MHRRRRRVQAEQGQLAVEDAAGRGVVLGPDASPVAATISRQIAKPRPVPPLPDFVLLDWTNLSNTISISSAGMPGPSSRTLINRALASGAPHVDRALRRRELDGVAQQVADHLLEPLGIDHGGGVLVRRPVDDRHLPLGAQRIELVDDDFHQVADAAGLEFIDHPARFQLRQVQQVVDQPQQRLRALADVLKELAQFFAIAVGGFVFARSGRS